MRGPCRTQNMPPQYRRIAFGCGVAALAVAFAGCGPARARPVKAELAKATLIRVLDHWKLGGEIEELDAETPKVVVQEDAWSKGQKLEDYTLLGPGRVEDANWFCEVEVTLAAADGKAAPKKKKFTYVVGTDPVLTVFHAIL